MRIIWISIGLLALIISISVAMFDPDLDSLLDAQLDSQSQIAASQDAAIQNPFANDEDEKSVDLAVLPTDKNDIENSSSEGLATTGSALNSDLKDTGESVEIDTASEKSLVVTEDSESLLVDGNKVAPDEKKLGLSMLVFEKEKKRNKIAIIVHEDNSQKLTMKEVKALYMDRLTRWENGARVMLYNLPLGDKHREKFSESILAMTALEADTAENKRRELHVNVNEVEVKAKNIVVSYVERNPNSVAYVPLLLVRDKSNVKVILTIP